MRPARILSIAGSDSSGGAGIQADIKTASALGVYAMTAITAITAQDTTGVGAIVPVAPEVVAEQISRCLTDIGADAIKTGMLGSATIVASVANVLDTHAKGVPLVVDPVMVATSGAV
ncbi:MAG: bifunctional hydroxymethylpyrimidine kinase/phosphomethylpyrimidine kinase, partial [Alphaproteobacteria bacterium]|nr:bifunctional hydroxymethylpyrimidine kinase/phosphomethylpyrimidine kinase [Alphaproteobacteria bacterium]